MHKRIGFWLLGLLVPALLLGSVPQKPVAANPTVRDESTLLTASAIQDDVTVAAEDETPTDDEEYDGNVGEPVQLDVDLPNLADVDPTVELDAPLTAVEVGSEQGKQGNISLDVEVEAKDTSGSADVRAGNNLIYTYSFTNNSGATATNVYVEVTWQNFSPNYRKNIQSCDPSPCTVLSTTGGISATRGDEVRIDNKLAGYRVDISDLNAGQTGSFSIEITTRPNDYPLTNKAPKTPAGSGALYANSSEESISEASASALIVGPVFNLTKTQVDPADKGRIYATETTTFDIVIGNRTGENDGTRNDARDASSIVITDQLPAGSELVQPVQTPDGVTFSYDEEQELLTWTFASLPVGASVTLPVTFRKLDVDVACTTVQNSVYRVTSNEMPLSTPDDPDSRLTVKGNAATTTVTVPMDISSVAASPSKVDVGETSVITIKVRNRYNQPLTNVRLTYTLQIGARYVPDQPVLPQPDDTPTYTDPTDTGGDISWLFDMPAGDHQAPEEITFTFTVRVLENTGSKGVAILNFDQLQPASMPTACIKSRNGSVGVNAPPKTAIRFTKVAENATGEKIGSAWRIDQGETVTFRITVVNNGPDNVSDFTIRDVFPKESTAGSPRFVYVQGSSVTVPDIGQPIYTEAQLASEASFLEWRNVSLGVDQEIEITYRVTITGSEFYTWCNSVRGETDQANVTFNSVKACVKINPDIEFVKTADRSSVRPGDQPRFTTTVRNLTGQTYEVGIADDFNQLTNYRLDPDQNSYLSGQPGSFIIDSDIWVGERVQMQPGGVIEAFFIGNVPGTGSQDKCERSSYLNEVLLNFKSAQTGEEYLVRLSGSDAAKVNLPCVSDNLQYSHSFPSVTGQENAFPYTITITSKSDEVLNNIEVVQVLPPGFQYLQPSAESDVTDLPQIDTSRPDGRVVLTWKLESLAGRAKVNIRSVVRAGQLIRPEESWVWASADGTAGFCSGKCRTVVEGEGDNEVIRTYNTTAVTVEALATINPVIVSGLPLDGECLVLDPLNPSFIDYRVTVQSQNRQVEYSNTEVSITLPIGVQFVEPLEGTPPPQQRVASGGETQLVWSDQNIPVAPSTPGFIEVQYSVRLQISSFVVNVPLEALAISPNGLIPQKELVETPQITTCIPEALIGLAVSPTRVLPGGEVTFQLTLANPADVDIPVQVDQTLPEGFTFVDMLDEDGNLVNGTPQLAAATFSTASPVTSNSGRTLQWSNMMVPAGTVDEPSYVIMRYRASVDANAPFGTKTVSAKPSSQVQSFDERFGTTEIEVVESSGIADQFVFIPLTVR